MNSQFDSFPLRYAKVIGLLGDGYSIEGLSTDRWKKSASMDARLIMDAKEVVALFNALLTPLIAVVAVYIAWQQWQTNKQKL
jgi:hypothetical protein